MISRCFNDGSKRAEILDTFRGSKTPRGLLSDFRHSQIPFRLVIRKRHSKVEPSAKPSKVDDFIPPPFQREVQHLQVMGIVVYNCSMMRCGQETTTVPMRRNEGMGCHDQKLPSLDLHLRSNFTLTGMRAGCCTPDWNWGVVIYT